MSPLDREPDSFSPAADEALSQTLNRNHLFHGIEGGMFAGGMSFLSAESVMPAMMVALGAPVWIVAAIPVMTIIGLNLPTLFTAHLVERMQRIRGAILLTGIFQRAPYVIVALALYFLWPTHPRTTVILVATAPLISGLAGGITYVAWLEFVARTIDLRRVSSLFARRYLISSTIGLAAGPLIVAILKHWPDHRGYALLHAIAAVFLWLSYAFFACVKEPQHHFTTPRPRTSLRDNLRSLPVLWRNDTYLRSFVGMRIFQTGILVMTPFLAAHALKITGQPKGFVGLFVTSQTLGAIAGNLLGHRLGDRRGGWAVARLSVWFYFVTCLLVIVANSMTMFILVFGLYGTSTAINLIGRSALQLEAFPSARRPTCLAVDATVNALALFGMIGISTALNKLFPTTIVPPTLVGLCCILASLIPMRKLRFVRAP